MAKKQKRNKKTASKYIIGFILAVLLVAALSFGVIVFMKQMQADKNEKDSAKDRNTANEILKTEEDLKDENKVAESSNNAKDRMEADEQVKTVIEQDDSGLIIANPEISFIAEEGDNIAIGGAVPNINETGGTCTYVFEKDSTTVTASAKTLPNPSYISCETARIDKSKFTSGVWSVKIVYKSNNAEGASEAQSYTVQ